MKLKCFLFVMVASLLLGTSINSYAEAAPGAEQRCEKRVCTNVGGAVRCHTIETRCKERADAQGTAYRNCRASGKTVAQCRGGYQHGMGNE